MKQGSVAKGDRASVPERQSPEYPTISGASEQEVEMRDALNYCLTAIQAFNNWWEFRGSTIRSDDAVSLTDVRASIDRAEESALTALSASLINDPPAEGSPR